MIVCPGPLIWFDAPASPVEADAGLADQAILECSACGYVTVTGSFHDERHAKTPLLREGLSA